MSLNMIYKLKDVHECNFFYKKLKVIFYWFFIKVLMKKFVEECEVYKEAKLERVLYPGLL
jgi:hypothetical protein